MAFPISPNIDDTHVVGGTTYKFNGAGWIIVASGGFGSFLHTESGTAPADPNVGDEWFNTTTGILYKRVSDGVQEVWLDFTGTGISEVVTTTTGGFNISTAVASDPTGISGATAITNMVQISQANYDLLTPDANTFYVIVG